MLKRNLGFMGVDTTVMLGSLVVIFTCGAVGVRYDPFSPVSSVAVLYWFGG